MSTTIPVGFAALPLPIVQLSLAAVLKCGQSFRWNILPLLDTCPPQESSFVPTHEYRLCLRDRVICLRQNPETLFFRAHFPFPTATGEEEAARNAETLAWIKDYFQLDVDLTKLYSEWSQRDPVFAGVKARFSGIRMLRQDPWENLISCVSWQALNDEKALIHLIVLYARQTITSLVSPEWLNLCASNTLRLYSPCHLLCPMKAIWRTSHRLDRMIVLLAFTPALVESARHTIRFHRPLSWLLLASRQCCALWASVTGRSTFSVQRRF